MNFACSSNIFLVFEHLTCCNSLYLIPIFRIGGGEAPKAVSGRLVAATWWLYGFLLIAFYTANLAAFLTVFRLETPIESLDDLTKQQSVQYGPMNGTSALVYFQRMQDIENQFYRSAQYEMIIHNGTLYQPVLDIYRVSQKQCKPMSIPYFSKSIYPTGKFYIPVLGTTLVHICVKL